MSMPIARFEAICKILVGIVFNMRSLVWLLCTLAADGDKWASGLLNFLMSDKDGRPRNALLCALVAEFVQSVSRFLHNRCEKDNSKHVIRTARDILALQTELDELLEGDAAKRKLPLVHLLENHGRFWARLDSQAGVTSIETKLPQ